MCSVHVRLFSHILHRLEQGRIDLLLVRTCDLMPCLIICLFVYLFIGLTFGHKSGPSRRGAFVQLAVAVGRMALACVMHSRRKLSLFIRNPLRKFSTRRAENTHLWHTSAHIQTPVSLGCTQGSPPREPPPPPTKILADLRVLRTAVWRTDPSVTAGLGFFFYSSYYRRNYKP